MGAECGIHRAVHEEESRTLELIVWVEGQRGFVRRRALNLHRKSGLLGSVVGQVEGVHVVGGLAGGSRDVLIVHQVFDIGALVDNRRGDTEARCQIAASDIGCHDRCTELTMPKDRPGDGIEAIGIVVLGIHQELPVVDNGLAVDLAVDGGVEQLAESSTADKRGAQIGLVRIPAAPVVVGAPSGTVGRAGGCSHGSAYGHSRDNRAGEDDKQCTDGQEKSARPPVSHDHWVPPRSRSNHDLSYLLCEPITPSGNRTTNHRQAGTFVARSH